MATATTAAWGSERPGAAVGGAARPPASARTGDQVEALHRPLIDRLTLTTPLTRTEAVRVVGDIMDYFGEPMIELVRRRHRELATERLGNPAIFARVLTELPYHRVVPPELSLRQLRRVVYG